MKKSTIVDIATKITATKLALALAVIIMGTIGAILFMSDLMNYGIVITPAPQQTTATPHTCGYLLFTYLFQCNETITQAQCPAVGDASDATVGMVYCPYNACTGCNCQATGATAMPMVTNLRSYRSAYIDQLNNGTLTNYDTMYFNQGNASFLKNCACPIVKSDGSYPDPSNWNMITINTPYGNVTGSRTFVQKAAKLLSKMMSYNTSNKTCTQKPVSGCSSITSSFRSPYIDINTPGGSPHNAGMAMDFCCSGQASADTLINNIKTANSGIYFHILREATANEKTCTSETGCGAIVHVDLKPRNGCSATACLFQNMSPCAPGEGAAQGCFGNPLCRGWTSNLPSY